MTSDGPSGPSVARLPNGDAGRVVVFLPLLFLLLLLLLLLVLLLLLHLLRVLGWRSRSVCLGSVTQMWRSCLQWSTVPSCLPCRPLCCPCEPARFCATSELWVEYSRARLPCPPAVAVPAGAHPDPVLV
ncbi:unnamed protein product [Prorocentrum cordatum]|uniref:Uncharacterized protein n=1 Tax=Prorocentrum cordatum TaxID=2364126 RepID=A0ABN9WBZ4_9DINO|nr:unnamed protein product [Polarella glacialis]